MSDELSQLWKEIADIKRRAANTVIDGEVVEVDGNKVRLQLEPPSGDGEPFLSPWVRVQEEAGNENGGYSSYTQKQVGQPMRLLSPNGEIGPASTAMDNGHTDTNPSPRSDNAKIFKMGDATITMVPGEITFAVGGCSVVITGSEIVTHGKTRLNNGTKPIQRQDDLDDAGDKSLGGGNETYS